VGSRREVAGVVSTAAAAVVAEAVAEAVGPTPGLGSLATKNPIMITASVRRTSPP